MAATIYDLDTTAANNTVVDGISQAENIMRPPAVNNAFRALDAILARYVDDLGAVNTVGGTGNAITVTLASGFTAYATGQHFRFIAGAANTGATTLNVNGIGAKAVRKISGGVDVALSSGDIAQGETYLVRYDAAANSAAGAWIIVGGSSNYLPLTGGTLTGSLAVKSAAPIIDLVEADNSDNYFRFVVDGGAFTIRYNGLFPGVLAATSDGAITALKSFYTLNATGGDKGADTINTSTYYKNGNYGVITLGTSVASTSGTSIDFTGIPSGVRRVTVLFSGLSSGTASQVPLFQIGAGSIDTSGYSGGGITGSTGSGSSSGLRFGGSALGASEGISGVAIWTLVDASTNLWVGHSVSAYPTAGNNANAAATTKTLSGTLDRIRVTTAGGTAAFNAGTINISYE